MGLYQNLIGGAYTVKKGKAMQVNTTAKEPETRVDPVTNRNRTTFVDGHYSTIPYHHFRRRTSLTHVSSPHQLPTAHRHLRALCPKLSSATTPPAPPTDRNLPGCRRPHETLNRNGLLHCNRDDCRPRCIYSTAEPRPNKRRRHSSSDCNH